MIEILFYIFAGITVLTTIFVVWAKNPIYSVFSLIVSFFALACIYVLLGAHFIAIIQILVYAGAIMVLFLFVVMLLNLKDETKDRRKINLTKVFGFLFSFAVLGIIAFVIVMKIFHADLDVTNTYGNISGLAKHLFTFYLVPFELASVLLLVAIIGTVILIRKR